MFLVFLILINVCLVIVLVVISWVVSNNSGLNNSMHTAFECGFDTFGTARVPFSLSFFLLAIVFLVFDVEIIILFPLSVLCFYGLGAGVVVSFFVFILILLVGLFYEWVEGSLDWICA